MNTRVDIECRGAAKDIQVYAIPFRVRVTTKVALGQDKNACRSEWFKLVKCAVHNCKLAPFSNLVHNEFQMFNF